MKIINLNRTLNTRDLGGYRTLDGRIIQPFRFIRSDAPVHLTDKEIQSLLDQGVGASIDLRTPYVAKKYPSVFASDQRFEYHLVSISEGTTVPLEDEQVPSLYMQMIAHRTTFYQIFKALVEAPGGVIFNCSAGKDRTGMVAFLLLEFAGVSRDTIAEDYAASSTLIDKNIERIRSYDPNFPAFLGYSKRDFIEKFFVMFDEKYGSIKNYLTLIGLDQNDLEKLTQKLFE
jgi:protein-tyrosine phosphatase